MLLRTAFNVSPTICASDFPKAAKTDVLSGNQTCLARITPILMHFPRFCRWIFHMFALKPPVAGFPHGFLPRQQQLQHFESQLREAQRQVAQRQRGRRGRRCQDKQRQRRRCRDRWDARRVATWDLVTWGWKITMDVVTADLWKMKPRGEKFFFGGWGWWDGFGSCFQQTFLGLSEEKFPSSGWSSFSLLKIAHHWRYIDYACTVDGSCFQSGRP